MTTPVIARRGTLPPVPGLHARPAADLVAAIVEAGRPVRVSRPGGTSVDGRSVLRVLGLGIHGGEDLELTLDDGGDDTAAGRLLDGLLGLLGASSEPEDGDLGTVLVGISAAPGAAAGTVARMAGRPSLPSPEPVADRAGEERRAVDSLRDVARDLRERASRTGHAARAVLEAGAEIADDPALHEEVARLARDGRPAAHAVADGIEPFRQAIADAGGDLSQRVADVDDVCDRAVALCLGLPLPGLPDPGHPYVLVADDLAPADAAGLDPDVVLAIVTVHGGPTGHTAILAREFGIPAVVACPGAADLATGDLVAVFASEGTVVVAPEAEHVAAVEAQRRPRVAAAPGRAGSTADGHRVALLANLGAPDRAPLAREAGAEGVGLLRTEFCFEGRGTAPTVAEQVAAYGEVARAFAGSRVVIRLLDAGADKPLPYIRAAVEVNPALGDPGPPRAARGT